ncbi:MAG TPA: type VI secretion system membrane subunit TssM [Blastocatellia bacterium]|nr:type VI secretion system membrane subunit TssM [Blastocatellia bacterium]
MSSRWTDLRYALGLSFYLTLYSSASMIVYYFGPYLGLTGYAERFILIGLILLTWPFAILIGYFRKRKEKREQKALEAADASSSPKAARAELSAPARTYEELTRSAEEAVQWLRSTKLAAAKNSDAVYSLPWFLVSGLPESGKTSLLLSAGLDFQALPSQRRADQNIVRPTRDCEWRVTDSSVLIDTAGRYQTEGPDQDEWSALIELLKKHRKNRPLDGMVIAVSAVRVLSFSEPEIEQQAKTLRARLDEVIRRAQNRFPVYLVFTHLDKIKGFEDFFRPFTRAERAQVWGATIPLDQSQNAHALFDVEFDYLYDALMRRRLVRLGAPARADEQLRVFDFPLFFGETRRKLGLFASALFRPNPFSEKPLMRGFYFTGTPSNGKPSAGAPSRAGASEPDGEAEQVQTAGEGYFTEHFFKDVLMRDKDLAASFQTAEQNPHRLRNILLGVGAALLLTLSIGMIVSFVGNKILIRDAVARASEVERIKTADIGKDLLKKDATSVRVELEALEELREVLADLDDYDRNSPPLYLRFGLYSGDGINSDLREIYFDSMTQRFFKPTVAAMEADLRAFTSGAVAQGAGPSLIADAGDAPAAATAEDSLGRYYDLLKAYLMLSNPERVEPTFLSNQLSDYWKRSAPPDMRLASEEQLKFYSRQAGRDDAPTHKPDDRLVAEARRKLAAYPAVNRIFKQMTSEIDVKVKPVTLEGVIQDRGRGVLAGSYAVPGSFTLSGYRDYWGEALETAAEEISKDDWVMGPQAATSRDQSADLTRLQSMYFREYTSQWQKFIKGVSVRPYRSKDDAIEAFKVLSASDSPMELLMVEVERNTNLSADEGGGLINWIKGFFSSTSESSAGTTEVEKEFRPLTPFVAGEDKKESAPASQYRAALRRVLDSLESKSEDQLQQAAKSFITGKDEIGLQKAEQDVSRLLDTFKTAAASDAARLLKQPLDNLRAMFYGGGYEQIDKGWREQIYPKARSLETGFPFTASQSQTPVTDLARFLNPANGQLTLFINDKLATSFEEAQGQWKLKESGAVKLSDAFVNYLNNARRLRDALFPTGGQQPEVSYELILQPVPGTDVMIDIDGTSVQARGTAPGSAKFQWPARAGTSGAKISVIKPGATPASLNFPGEWGLFQMFEAGSPTRTGDNQYQLSWNVGSTPVRALLRPSSATSPFELRLFTQMRAPQGPN